MAEAIQKPVTVEAFAMELLKDPMKDWYTMGFLLGLYEPTLKDIMWKHRPNGIEACLRGIFDTLKDQGVKLTWEQIIDALSTAAMDCKELAEEINQKYCGGTYTSTHGTYEECRKDEVIAITLLEICHGKENTPGIKYKGNGYFDVQSILKVKFPGMTKSDIRRVVANTPDLTLDRGKPLTIKAYWGHTDKEIIAEVHQEKKLYNYLSAVCRFGSPSRTLHTASDGSFSIQEITSGNSAFETSIRKTIKNSAKNELILFEDPKGTLRIKHATVHPPEAKKGGGQCKTTHRELLWSDVRTCCCEATLKNLEYDQVEGYLKASDIAKCISQLHKKTVTEEDVVDVVERCPDNCKQDWLILKRERYEPIQVKAKRGHFRTMNVERPYTTPRLTITDDIPPLVFVPTPRHKWAEHKKYGIVPTSKNRIHLIYYNFPLTDKEILEKYGCYKVIVIIDMTKAIRDGMEFYRQGEETIICMNDSIPREYFEKIL